VVCFAKKKMDGCTLLMEKKALYTSGANETNHMGYVKQKLYLKRNFLTSTCLKQHSNAHWSNSGVQIIPYPLFDYILMDTRMMSL